MTENEWRGSEDPAAMLNWSQRTLGVGGGLGATRHISDRKLRLFACATARLLEDTPPRSERTAVIEACEQVADGGLSQWGSGRRGLVGARKSIDSVWGWTWAATCEDVAVSLKETFVLMRGNAGSFYRQGEAADLLRDIVGSPWRSVTLPHCCIKCGCTEYEPEAEYAACTRCGNEMTARQHVTPTVLSLAQAAYDDHHGTPCSRCKGKGGSWFCPSCRGEWLGDVGPGCFVCSQTKLDRRKCPDCASTGRINDGTLDPHRLAILADALEEAGCCEQEPAEDVQEYQMCAGCNGHGTDLSTGRYPEECDACWACGGTGGVMVAVKKPGRFVVHPIVAHLRSPGPHWRGCHVLDCILGRD